MRSAEEKPTMKESQNGILSHSNGYKEEDSLGLQTKDLAISNGYNNSNDPVAHGAKDGNELWKVSELDDSFFGDISIKNHSEINVRDDVKKGGNPFVTDEIDADAASVRDDQNGGLSYKRAGNPFECDTKDRDQPWNIPEYESSMIVDFLDDKENGAVVSDLPFESHSEFFKTNTHFYTDKGVTDNDLPELAVCYRESNLNIIKDICMDEGEPAVDKNLVETWEGAQPGTSVFDEDQQSNKRVSVDKNNAETHDTEQEASGALVPNGSKLSPEDNANEEAEKDSYLEDVMTIFGSKCTTKATNPSEKTASSNNAVRSGESSAKNSQNANSGGDQSSLQTDQIPVAGETINKDPASDLYTSSNSTKPELTKGTDKGVESLLENSIMSKVMADDVHHQSFESRNATNADDKKSSGHFADGEASFSAAGPVSGSITYSGPISHSGSISLRSDSSTTSARSFAFPVLQNEWNSSPVRMAKAERRRLRKHGGWRQGILCCRF